MSDDFRQLVEGRLTSEEYVRRLRDRVEEGRLHRGCPDEQGAGAKTSSPEDLEQAWRNGWASALLMLRTADQMAHNQPKRMGHDPFATRTIRDLIGKWIDLVEGLTEQVIEPIRERGGFAERTDALPSKDPHDG